MREIEVSALIPGSPEAVWRVYTDHRGWVDWAGVQEVVLRHEGEPPPNGIGATRVIRARGLAIEEEVVAFEPLKRMAYRLIGGLPIRDHRGEVEFEPTDSGTRLTWRVRFRASIPGTGPLIELVLRRSLRDMLQRLARVVFDD